MKRQICLFWLILALLMNSCSKRWCGSHYPPISDTIYKQIIKDSIIYKDTTIYIDLPEIVKIDSVQIPCPEPPYFWISDTAKVETDYAIAKAWFDYPNIQLSLKQKGTLKIQLENAIKDSWHWRSEYIKVSSIEKEKYIPRFYKTCRNICIFIFTIFFAWLGYKIIRFFKN